MAIFQSFWHGPELPRFVRMGMRSFLARGDRFHLYAYKKFSVPFGVTLIDANAVLPQSSVFYYKNPDGTNRSVAAFANLFRYCLLEKKGGWWVDADVLRLDAPLPRGELVLGKEDDVLVCNAIMKAPAGHTLIVQAKQRALAAGRDLTWGQTGPQLLTKLVAELGIEASVKPRGVVFPICPQQYALAAAAEGKAELARLTKGAPFLHLYHEMFRANADRRLNAPEEGSFLFDLYAFHKRPVAKLTRAARSVARTLHLDALAG